MNKATSKKQNKGFNRWDVFKNSCVEEGPGKPNKIKMSGTTTAAAGWHSLYTPHLSGTVSGQTLEAAPQRRTRLQRFGVAVNLSTLPEQYNKDFYFVVY